MVRWLRWHCPPDTGFEIRALAVWGWARYLSVTEAPHNTNFHTWMGKKQFCFFQTAETGNRTPDSGVKGSGANHYPRAPAQDTIYFVGYRTFWEYYLSRWNHYCIYWTIMWPASMARSYRMGLVTWRYQVRIPAGPGICHRGCAYTLPQTVQMRGV